ncbi:MAG: metalloregulator ArsR/SmtB family transcription factor [Candidatus Omnitrophica bacterium]|nr:metalloregulator ArsR/SmtB family transcription factor [Candidatus Omnitrophota bacterium]
MAKVKYNYLRAAKFLKALSHPTRLMIVNELALGKKCVNDIKELVQVNQPNISQHLSLLKLNGIVDSRQNGKMKCYFLKDEAMMREMFNNLKKNKLI